MSHQTMQIIIVILCSQSKTSALRDYEYSVYYVGVDFNSVQSNI